MSIMGYIIGMCIGCAATNILYLIKQPTVGTLLIDQSDDTDKYHFVIADLDKLSKHKYITIKVNSDADLSQK